MSSTAWKVWNRDDKVEQRTYKRATGELPEMECTKQLVSLVAEVYKPGMTVLDVGCAAGHYYNGLRRLDPGIRYFGADATVAQIDFTFQNVWSFESFRITAATAGAKSIESLDARFDATQINREFADFDHVQSGATKVQDGAQIARSKVFEWK